MFKRKWTIQCEYENGEIKKFTDYRFRTYKRARMTADFTELFCLTEAGRILIFTPVHI